jgi:uncharacterized protein
MYRAFMSITPFVFAAWLGVVAASPGALAAGVSDEGGFFSAAAVEKADAKINEIYREYGKGLLIDTVAGVPESQQAKYNELGKKDFFVAWARQRAEEARAKGIYVLICRKPAHVQVEMDRETRGKAFTAQDRERLLKGMIPLLKNKQNDAALLQTVDFVGATFRANLGRRAAAPAGVPGVEHAARHGGVSSWGWIGIIIVVLLGCWLLMGVMRGIGGMGGGGGPGGGGWGGGGGGGFFSSLLGGMFGAAAGSWLYDSFRGGSQGFGSSGYQDTPTGDQGAGDFSGDTGGGADFGDDSGGGVAEDPGGGDFGGGDSGGGGFGGGDFGGGDSGGGDFG